MRFTLAVVVIGLVWLWKRGYFSGQESQLSASTLRRIRAAEGQEAFARDMDDARIVVKPTVLDGPPRRALSRPWSPDRV